MPDETRRPIKALPEGEILEDRYRILGILGQGGMSRVYLAEDTRLTVRVAIKENLQTSRKARSQFQREAQILARLSHPNLPRVTDHFIDPISGRQYLVMDYVEGEDLESMVKRRKPIPEKVALAWIWQVLDALEYLHSQSPPVIHRDVKPGNIKITPEGRAVLVDFGIAKVYAPGVSTLTGARAVTPGYAPPEQYGMRTTEQSDIYALGATLYTMLTGRVPPEAPLRVAGERLVPPRQIVPDISPRTEEAILRAVELETSKRWRTVSELRAALEGRIKAPAVARPIPKRPSIRRVGGPFALAGAIGGLILLALLFLAFWGIPKATMPRSTFTPLTPTPAPPMPIPLLLTPTPVQPTPTPLPSTPMPTPTPSSPTSTSTFTPRPPTPTPTFTPRPFTPKPTATPSPAPAGRIAFASNRDGNDEIYVMNADGARLVRLTNYPGHDGELSWSPDGSKIAFSSVRDGKLEIYVMNADGTGQVRLTNNPGGNWSPSWSPDGRRITFVSYRDSNWEIYVMNADRTGQVNLTDNPASDENPSWSPDGKRIAFASDRDGNWEIYMMNADGTGQVNLTNNPASDENPSWSPDGRRIAFVSDRDGNDEIYVMNADGTELVRFTNNPAGDWLPSWSPDGRRIAFVSYRDGNHEIYAMTADGTGQVNLTNNPARDTSPAWSR